MMKSIDMFISILKNDDCVGEKVEYSSPGYGGDRIPGTYACTLISTTPHDAETAHKMLQLSECEDNNPVRARLVSSRHG
jgi:hypothetical protein